MAAAAAAAAANSISSAAKRKRASASPAGAAPAEGHLVESKVFVYLAEAHRRLSEAQRNREGYG